MLNLQKYGDLIPNMKPTVSLTAGKYLNISSQVYINPKDDDTEVAEAIQQLSLMDPEWLKAELESSTRLEDTIAADAADTFSRWVSQAKVSKLLQSANEVIEAKRPDHSGYKWDIYSIGDRTTHNISNAVYKMMIEAQVGDRYFRKTSMTLPEWVVTWRIGINGIYEYIQRTNISCLFAGGQKKFTDKERAEKYIEAVKAQNTHYFEVENPAVPQKSAQFFMVNGVLLPGYSVEPDSDADAGAA